MAMKITQIKIREVSLALAAVFAGGLTEANAAGFALIEQNASGLGNAYAGAAVAAEDASTIYFNPAGLTALPAGKHVVFAIHAIDPSAQLRDGGSLPAAGIRPPGLPNPYTSSGSGGNAGGTAYVPNAYFAMSLDPRWSIGVGLNAPFGLKTQYDDGWAGRFQGIKSELKAVNINPTLAYKLNDNVSLGFGLDYQQIDATLTKAVNYTAIVGAANAGAAVAVGNVEGRNQLKGEDSAWGYNLGATFRLSDDTKVGVAYRSTIQYRLTGTHSATHPVTGNVAADAIIAGNPGTQDQNIAIDVKMPDSFSFSALQRLNERWDLLGDLTWTGWGKIAELRVKFTVPGAADDVTNLKFRNTMRASVGANYRYSDSVKLRFGVAYDQSPVSDQYRTVRLPDNNRTWFSLGAQYKVTREGRLDAGFAYLKVKDGSINNNGEVAATALGFPRGQVNGSYGNSVRILSLQYSHLF
jgi:long-chain fatty acid transport protein